MTRGTDRPEADPAAAASRSHLLVIQCGGVLLSRLLSSVTCE